MTDINPDDDVERTTEDSGEGVTPYDAWKQSLVDMGIWGRDTEPEEEDWGVIDEDEEF